MPRSPRHVELQPEETTQRRLAEAEEARKLAHRSASSGPAGATGATGPEGPEGRYGDLHYKFSTTQTSSDPGSGFFRLNKAPVAESPTELYISETDADAAKTEGLIHTWGLSSGTPKGYLLLRKRNAPAVWAFYKVKSLWTDEGTWDKFEIEKISSEGTWSNNDEFFLTFIPNGDKGATGAAGPTGAEGPKGEKGETGAKGEGPGLAYISSNVTTRANPGGAKFRLNNAGVHSATQLYISETEQGGANVASLIQEWDDAGSGKNRGWLIIRRAASPSEVSIFKVTGVIEDEGEWDAILVTWVAGSMTTLPNELAYTLNFIPVGEAGAAGTNGSNGATGAEGPPSWTPEINSSLKSLGAGAYEKITNVEGDAKLVSKEGFTNGCFVTFVASSTTKGLGIGLNSDPNTDLSFGSIDYWINLTSSGTVLIKENGVEQSIGSVTYVAGDIFTITHDGQVVRYFKNHAGTVTLLRETNRLVGNPLYLDSWWNQEGGKIENLRFGPMGMAGEGQPGSIGWAYASSITMENPSSGNFRLNNATPNLVTEIAFDYEDAVGFNNDKAWLLAADDSTSTVKGYIVLSNRLSGSIIYKVKEAVEETAGTWVRMKVEYIAGNLENLVAGALFTVNIQRTGDKGEGVAQIPYTYSTTVTEAAPGKGFLRFNNATLTSATSLFISRFMLPEVAIKQLIGTWDDSTSTVKGYLTMRKESDPSTLVIYSVTGTVVEKESGEWLVLSGLTNLISNGSFANNDRVLLEFRQTGDKGATGAEGQFAAAYRDVARQASVMVGSTATGTYILGNSGLIATTGAKTTVPGGVFFINPTDYEVSGKTTKFRLEGVFANNATAVGATVTLKYALKPVTESVGESGGIVYTLGAAVLTTEVVTGLAAKATQQVVTATPATLEKKLYAVVVEVGVAANAAASFVSLNCAIQVKNE